MASLNKMCNNVGGLKPVLVMVLMQTIVALVDVSYKLAANDGMCLSILAAYRFMFGAAFMVPTAYFWERKRRPKMTRKIIFYGFLGGLFGGSLGVNLFLKSLDLTCVTFATAMTNLIPATTYLISICLRLERVEWNTNVGKSKIMGTIISLSGAMFLTFYKGPKLNVWDTHINLLNITSKQVHSHQKGGQNMVFGVFIALLSCVCYSLLTLVQAKTIELYPCPLSVSAMIMVWATIQGVGFAVWIDGKWSDWILGWNIRLLCVVFSGIFGYGLMISMMVWAVQRRGPLFVSIFNPLTLIVVGIVCSLFLEEDLHLGMLLGGILIVAGKYFVLWGKSKEVKMVSQEIMAK